MRLKMKKKSSILEHQQVQTERRTEVKTEYDIPVDRGWALVVLCGAFWIAAIVTGGIKSFGVLLVEFVEVFDVPKSYMSFVLSLTGFFYLGLGPVTNGLTSKFSYRSVIMAGGVLSSSGLILSYFAKSINLLVFTYGIITGVIRDHSGSWSLAFRVGGACAFIGITILIADIVMQKRSKYRQKRKESTQ